MINDSYMVYNKRISTIEKKKQKRKAGQKGITRASMVHNPIAHSGCTSPEGNMKELREGAMLTPGRSLSQVKRTDDAKTLR